ncbi:imidazole glycerol phosphate synthase subunit HisH [Francisellaceae bacterium]|nr:imidazole glycerol phosphate synthase subunit HisH [Francisellaceae bacterium]
MIALIDACGNNLASVKFAFERLGQNVCVTADPDVIQSAEYVILPGVGQAALGMQALKNKKLDILIPRLTQPVLGICLGMQLLFEHSDEDNADCLGIFPGQVRRFPKQPNLIVPHMGWNTLALSSTSHFLTKGFEEEDRVYFVHSFCAEVNDVTIATNDYGHKFAAIVQRDNFYGMQFHPEKSGKIGEQLLKNFLEGS